MSKPALKLKKIYWELTSECYNCCSYCGARDVSHIRNSDKTIKRILNSIVEYPPDQIQMSGGDPLLVDFDTHKFVVDTLSPTTFCEISVNPKSDINLEILKLYGLVYISLNTLEEIEKYEINWKRKLADENIPVMFATNFNLLNFFLAEKISKIVGNAVWKIDFTLYGDPKHALAIYDQELALNKLNSDLSMAGCNNIVIGNTANCEYCDAGIHSLGLLYDGTVVPCLSMRFWIEIRKKTLGNITQEKLKDIWYKKFENQRFTEWFCCKNQCKNKVIDIRKKGIILKELPKQILICDGSWATDIVDCFPVD